LYHDHEGTYPDGSILYSTLWLVMMLNVVASMTLRLREGFVCDGDMDVFSIDIYDLMMGDYVYVFLWLWLYYWGVGWSNSGNINNDLL
jgi:hypothetical protein